MAARRRKKTTRGAGRGLEKVEKVEELGRVGANTVAIEIKSASVRSLGKKGARQAAGRVAAALQHTPNMQTLRVSGIEDVGVSIIAAALQHTLNLQTLDLSWCRIGDAGASAIAAALQHTPNLQTLNLSSSKICDAGASIIAAALQHTPNLQELHLDENEIGDAGASAIAAALQHTPNLQTLDLASNQIGDAGASAVAAALQHTPNLQTLNLSWCSIGGAGASAIAAALQHTPNLQQLNLASNQIGDARVSAIAAALQHTPNLQTLDLSWCGIGDAGASAIAAALQHTPNLQTLDLSWCSISDAGASAIAAALQHTPNLQMLCLTGIDDAGASAIATALQQTPNLQTLHLAWCGIGDAGASAIASALQHTPNLKELYLGENEIGDAGASAIAAALQHTPNLQELGLGSKNIGDAGASAIAAALQHTSSLQELWLSNSNIGDAGASAVAAALQHTPNLQELGLNKNQIGDTGASAIAAALQHTPNLQTLRLGGNEISDAGASAVAAALQHTPNLQTLRLGGNEISDAGASAVAAALQHTPNLQELWLSSNNIGDAGVSAIAAALQHTPNLQTLKLDSTQIGDAGASAIAAALQHTPNLQDLNFGRNNQIGKEGAALLAACCVLMPVYCIGFPKPAGGVQRPSPDEAHRLLAAARKRHAPQLSKPKSHASPLPKPKRHGPQLPNPKSCLADLAAHLTSTTGPHGALSVYEEHVAPLLQHVPEVAAAVRSADAALESARVAVPGDLHAEPSVAELQQLIVTSLEKATRGELSREDETRLQVARQRQVKVLRRVEDAAAHVDAVDAERARLASLQSRLSESLQAAPCSSMAAVSATALEQLATAASEAETRMGNLQAIAEPLVRQLAEVTDEMNAVSRDLSAKVASALQLPADADVAEAALAALIGAVAARLEGSSQLLDAVHNGDAAAHREEVLHLKATTKLDIADATVLPGIEDQLREVRVAMEDEEDEVEEQARKLRKAVRRSRLTAQERTKREAGIAELQRHVAELRAEMEALEQKLEDSANHGLPEAVQLLTTLRSQYEVPEVLRMLQPTGLYRNRNLATDYQEVADVQVVSGRYQMRVVRPVSSEDLKVLKAFPAEMFKQIRNEVVNVARVEHPNVLRPELVFMGADNTRAWVQYPYMARGSLDRWLAGECVGSVELLSREGHELLCGVFREVLDGVVHLHANGVVHNDLKPANVLMGDDLVPHICDFELSNSVDVSGTRGLGSMTVRGLTVSYAAPEVVENQRSTEKSDMYSLGRLMYDTLLHEWLAEQQGAAAPSVAMMGASLPAGFDPRTRSWAFPDDVHPAFRDLVERLLSADPALRPSAVEARAHPFFTQRLFVEEEEVPVLSIQLDVAGALPERQYWLTDGNDEAFRRVPLDLHSPEAREVKALFRTRGCPRREIVAIERVESGELLRRFAFHKHHLETKYGAAVDEQLVFHGTKADIVRYIAEQGFDMRLNGTNGTVYGKGNYFARDSSYSADAFNGRFSPADANGVKWMFVARILVGETVRGCPQLRRAERPDGTLVDTAVDDEADPAIYVTFDNGQAIPVYVIGFR